jgi:DNA polymerase/3'-5' exonuclease PolX
MERIVLNRNLIRLPHSKIEQLTVELHMLSADKIFLVNGIGEAIGKKIIELTATRKIKMPDELLSKTPEGILEMMKIKGIGPKKIFYYMERNEVRKYWRTFICLTRLIIKKLLMHAPHITL